VGREVEGAPAISFWAAWLPDVSLLAMYLRLEQSAEGKAIVGWPDELPESWPDGSVLLLLADPFTFPADALLERLNEDRPGVPIVGGIASGGSQPGENRLLLAEDVHTEGAVALLMRGAVGARILVSQGCRPVGKHFVVTKAKQNVIHELGGKPALLQLKEVFDSLPTRDQQLLQNGLHLGRVVSEYQDRFEQGDFLVRNVMGIDPDNGSVIVTDVVRVGQTVQFHLRDQQTADQELRQLLAAVRDDSRARPMSALLFTCNGRGTRMFDAPHHDAATVKEFLGDIPLAGFFAAGEVGPVGGKNFLHGFTASMVLF
ncbi:MAG: FIST C-terminal domain-containing protein, partial [Planctomycetes bacterium]|nr:FIST C-terminal domain-containing protein [Planctomycetota bacterium]